VWSQEELQLEFTLDQKFTILHTRLKIIYKQAEKLNATYACRFWLSKKHHTINALNTSQNTNVTGHNTP